MSGLVEYQEGAVVSREIVRGTKGTVTVFAFDEGQGLSEHTAPFDALVYVFDGSAEVVISGRMYRVNSGQMIVMPAGEPHSLNAVERFRMLLVLIRE
ncbi:MAG: cupin domain-containing protein [bacterium]